MLRLKHSFIQIQRGYVESFNGRMRDELLNESLFFGLDHARSAIAEWAHDYNNFRPHSSLGYQTPADYAGIIAATGSNATQCGSFAFPPGASHRAIWRIKNRRGSNRSRMKLQWHVWTTSAWQGAIWHFCRVGRVQACIRPFEAADSCRWP